MEVLGVFRRQKTGGDFGEWALEIGCRWGDATAEGEGIHVS